MRHDFTRGTERNGWGIVGFDFLDSEHVRVQGWGLKPHIPGGELRDFYFLVGEELVISLPDGTGLYEIEKIHYGLEPYDLFTAEARYIQHLTGFKCIYFDKERSARSLEWSKHISDKASGGA